MAPVAPRGHRPKPHLWVIGAAFGAAKLLKQLLALLHLLFIHRPPLGHELSYLRALTPRLASLDPGIVLNSTSRLGGNGKSMDYTL